MIKHIALGLALLASVQLFGQQVEQLSLYMMNDYVINPAVAGSRTSFEGAVMNRNQWSGIEDAPRTFTLSLTAPFKNKHVGMGGYLFVDNAGPTRRTGIQLSYSYHFQVTDQFKLGLGASMGALQFAIDGTRITLTEQGDPALYSEYNRQILFDAKFGVMGYGENYYVGVTLPQLLQNKVRVYESLEPGMNRLEDHYLFHAGYKYTLGDFRLEPSVLLKYVQPTPLKIDATLRTWYKDMVWIGGSWRSNDAVVAMVGYEWNKQLSIGVAYDFSISQLSPYAGSTTEIVLGFKMP